MASDFSNYGFGKDGVNLVKNPLQLGDGEGTQFQNVEFVLDAVAGGEGALSMRGGFTALTSALAGSILGGIGLNLKTTYTRTLYAGKGTEDSTLFRKSTNGTSWSNSTAPLQAARNSKFTDANGERDARRIASFRNFIVYPYDTYTKGTDNPPFAIYDGTDALSLGAIPVGPSATAATPAYVVEDMLVADGKIFFAVHDPGGSAPDLAGRVMSLDLETGVIKQVATAFGNGTNDITGGYPCCLAWYQNQIWAGLQGNTTTDAIGKVVRCIPDVDQTWTSDVANLSGFPCSLAVYNGDLYAGTQSSTSSAEKVYKRPATTRVWAASFTGVGAGASAFCTSLIVYGTNLYAAQYHTTAPTIHIKKWDGTTWTTDRDVDATDGATAQMPGNSIVLGSDLYFVFRALTDGGNDGFILRLSGGTWTKVDTDNFNGMLTVLVERT